MVFSKIALLKSAVALGESTAEEITFLKVVSIKIASPLNLALEKLVCPVKFTSLKSAFSLKCVDAKLAVLPKTVSWKIAESLNFDSLKLTTPLNSAS